MIKTFQINLLTLFVLTSLVACLCCLCFVLGRTSQLERQLRDDRMIRPRFDASFASGCFDIECVLRSDPADASVYTFTIRTGEPHTLVWKFDGQESEYQSFWSPQTYSHTTELSLAVTPNASGSAVAILLNKTTRLAFDDDRPGNTALTEPTGNGYGSGGYYDQWSEPETLIEWTGSRSARMTLRFSKP
ncbi:hypothetical protein VN12_26220 [Pirellula sp. SH-Sr6A]|nr:hypothetical protein VN12_26220 [Pirellula sp. SH-Sr6A]